MRQSYLRAKRSMIALNFGSFTFSAACEAESHFTTRSCFSGHCLFWRLTSRGKTRTSQTTAPPLLSCFSYENEPTECLATAPTTQPLQRLHAPPNDGATCLFCPALRDDPAPGSPRRAQHKLRWGTAAQPVGQGGVLNAPRGGYFTRTTHRRRTPLNAYLAVFDTQAVPPDKVTPCRRVRKEIYKARKRRPRTMPPPAASRSKPRPRRWPRSNARRQACGRHLPRQWRR